jgi:creatinine amidohydrolase
MKALVGDVIASLGRDGVSHVFCVSGHGDALHNRTILESCEEATDPNGIAAVFVASPALFERLGVQRSHPCTLATASEFPTPRPGAKYLDVHAGDWETSVMLAIRPDLVAKEELSTLPDTMLGPEDLAIWRKGHEHAREVTPEGYFGDPASATASFGLQEIYREGTLIAEAILRKLREREDPPTEEQGPRAGAGRGPTEG